MIETEIVLGAQEALLDGPAQSGSAGHFGKACSLRDEGEVIGDVIALAQATAHEKPLFKPVSAVLSQRDPCPVIQTGPLGAFTGTERRPGFFGPS